MNHVKIFSILISFVCCFCLFSVFFDDVTSKDVYIANMCIAKKPLNELYKSIMTTKNDTFVLSAPSPKSLGSKMTIVMPVKTSDFVVRNELRRLWKDTIKTSAGTISLTFLVGRDSKAENGMFQYEVETFQDILHVDVVESYRNMIYKEAVAFRWLSSLNISDQRFIVKMDNDVSLDSEKMLKYLESIDANDAIFGDVVRNTLPIRDTCHRWFVSLSSYSGQVFPDYVAGPLYIMRLSTLKVVVKVAKYAKPIEIEDAFWTGIVAEKAGVRRVRPERKLIARWDHPVYCSSGIPDTAAVWCGVVDDEMTIEKCVSLVHRLPCTILNRLPLVYQLWKQFV